MSPSVPPSAEPVRDRAPSTRGVETMLPRPRPRREVLDGVRVRLEPLDPERHGADLYAGGHDGSPDAERSWEYLPYGPFSSQAEHRSWLQAQAAADDPLFFAIAEKPEGRAAGLATLMSIEPDHGSIEIGHIWLSPGLQRTPAATEALVLLLTYALEELGYRRMEWKCNAANASSRRAAIRLGYTFEGIFYNHKVYKGRNRDTAWYSILDEEWPRLRAAYASWLARANFDGNGAQRQRLSDLTRRKPADDR